MIVWNLLFWVSYMYIVFWYLHLFNATEHVSHGKSL